MVVFVHILFEAAVGDWFRPSSEQRDLTAQECLSVPALNHSCGRPVFDTGPSRDQETKDLKQLPSLLGSKSPLKKGNQFEDKLIWTESPY